MMSCSTSPWEEGKRVQFFFLCIFVWGHLILRIFVQNIPIVLLLKCSLQPFLSQLLPVNMSFLFYSLFWKLCLSWLFTALALWSLPWSCEGVEVLSPFWETVISSLGSMLKQGFHFPSYVTLLNIFLGYRKVEFYLL